MSTSSSSLSTALCLARCSLRRKSQHAVLPPSPLPTILAGISPCLPALCQPVALWEGAQHCFAWALQYIMGINSADPHLCEMPLY